MIFDVLYIVINIKNKDIPWLHFIFLSMLVILTIIYTITNVILARSMKKMGGNFKQEKSSIKCQFLVFLFSYTTQCAYIFVMTSEKFIEKLGLDKIHIFYLGMIFFWQILPPFTVLFLHHKAFRVRNISQKGQNNSKSNDEQQTAIVADNLDFMSETSSLRPIDKEQEYSEN